MSEYTEGPWSTEACHGVDNELCFHVIKDKDQVVLASTWAGPQLANINLMAAAPDLLEALENISNGIQTGAITSDYDETLENAVIKANNAILKAKGEQ